MIALGPLFLPSIGHVKFSFDTFPSSQCILFGSICLLSARSLSFLMKYTNGMETEERGAGDEQESRGKGN